MAPAGDSVLTPLGDTDCAVAEVKMTARIPNPTNPELAASTTKDARAAAHALGLEMQILNISRERDFDAAFAFIIRSGIDALIVGADPFLNNQRDTLVALAWHHAIPTIYEFRESVEAGGLISYGPSITDAYRQLGIYVDRILKGEKAADLPVVQPTKFELVINLKTAKALGLDVPPSLLTRADEVIE
jgi:putative ABC transport system substrate-binding protein